MTGVPEPGPHAFYHVEHFAVFDPAHLPHDALALLDRVQRLDALTGFAAAVLRIPLCQVRRIRQQDSGQLAAGLLGEYRAAKTPLDQQRQPPAMVQVGVAQDDRVYLRCIKGKRITVAFFFFAAALDQAAVEQHLFPVHVQDVTGARHFRRGSEKLELHDTDAGSSVYLTPCISLLIIGAATRYAMPKPRPTQNSIM